MLYPRYSDGAEPIDSPPLPSMDSLEVVIFCAQAGTAGVGGQKN